MNFESLYPAIGARPHPSDGPPKRVVSPVTAPTRGRKNTPAYNTHSYPTKVPPEAIEPFIERYTDPGHLVLDPFCGSGMTGLAALRLGRIPVLNDLSFGAVHLSWNVTTPCAPDRLRAAADEILRAVGEHYGRWYASRDANGDTATIAWTVHSQVLICPECGAESSVWADGTNRHAGTVASAWPCRFCGAEIRKRHADPAGFRPVWMALDGPSGRSERPPTAPDLELADEIAQEPLKDWVPRVPLGPDREMYIRSALHLHRIKEVADFWTPRNLRALARLWAEIRNWPEERERQALAFAFTNTAWHASRMRRFNARGGHRPLTGTLYIPQLSIEVNPALVFRNKIRQLAKFYEEFPTERSTRYILRGSATDLPLDSAAIDYCFTDPPFGSNIYYADCAVVWESWLGGVTPTAVEAVVNRSLKPEAGGKAIDDYGELMEAAFCEIARVLKPAAWATVVFNSTDAEIWAAIRTAVEAAGFDLANATYIDKTQQSHKGYKGRSGNEDVASFDIVLNLQKPGSRRRRPAPPRGVNEAARLLTVHLSSLPPIGASPERDRERTLPYLHSLLVRAHFNGGIGLEIGSYALVRRICEERFAVDSEGRWFIPERRTTAGPTSSI